MAIDSRSQVKCCLGSNPVSRLKIPETLDKSCSEHQRFHLYRDDKNTSSIYLYVDKRVKQNSIKAILQTVKKTTDVCGVHASIAVV